LEERLKHPFNLHQGYKSSLSHIEKRAFIKLLSEENKMIGQKPLATIKAGAVSSAIFENEITVNGKKVTVMKATLQRRYKDKDGSWKSSNSFSKQELPLAIFCLEKCFEKMVGEDSGNNEEMPA
jgi:hypothetical protein